MFNQEERKKISLGSIFVYSSRCSVFHVILGLALVRLLPPPPPAITRGSQWGNRQMAKKLTVNRQMSKSTLPFQCLRYL